MKFSIANPQFVLLFTSVMLIAHTLAEPPEDVKNHFIASRQRYHEARLSASEDPPPPLPAFPLSNWAGGIQTEIFDQTFSSITAGWTVFLPKAPGGTLLANSKYGAAVWVGIDGYSQSRCTDRVIQAGVYSYLITGDSGQVLGWGTQTFTEWFPDPPSFDTNYLVRPADQIQVSVEITSANEATVTFQNPGNANPPVQVAISNQQYPACGGSAEWIMEASGGPGFLANFGLVDVDSCSTDLGGQTIGLDGANFISMSINGVEVAQSTQVNSNEMAFLYTGP